MKLEEVIYKLFGIPQEKVLSENIGIIEEKITSQTDEVSIEVREVDIDDPKKKLLEPTYLNDEYLHITDTGIKILHTTQKVVELLKNKIPRNIKSLTIPSEFLSDLSYLQEFPNLEKLTISDYSGFTPEQVDYIEKNTSIKRLALRSPSTINNMKNQPNCNTLEAGNIISKYGKLTMTYNNYRNTWNDCLKVTTSTFEENNIKQLEELYNEISERLPKMAYVTLDRTTSKTQDEITINLTNDSNTILYVKEMPIKDAASIYKKIKKAIPITKTKYTLKNKTYDDIYLLKDMASSSDLTIRYYDDGSKTSDANYAEFLNMRATIDYYKEIINASGLSPAEKTAYVYDILKTMKYKEDENDKSRPRNIHSIVTDGNIVCLGYSEFAKQLLNELGIKAITVSVTPEPDQPYEGHARNFVRIDDDKYNIHGLFAMDITWDSDKEITLLQEKDKKRIVSRPTDKDKGKIIDRYNSLILYRYFLTPMQNYEIRFPNEINPDLYETYKKDQGKKIIAESRKVTAGELKIHETSNMNTLKQHRRLFNLEEGPLTVEEYFNEPKPSLETFKQILANVRKAQGYEENQLDSEVERTIELHEMLREQSPNSPNHFFQPKEK